MKNLHLIIFIIVCSIGDVRGAYKFCPYYSILECCNIVRVSASEIRDTNEMHTALAHILASLEANKCGAIDQTGISNVINLQSNNESKKFVLNADTRLRLYFAFSTGLTKESLGLFLINLLHIGWLDKVEIITLDKVEGAVAEVIGKFPALFVDAGNSVLRK